MGAFHRGPRLGTKPLTTALAPDSPAPEGQQKAPSRLALPRLRRCAWSAECERSSASCENCVWCVPPVTSCTCTRRERIASVGAATQAKGARGFGCVQRPQHFLDAFLFLLRSIVTGISPCGTKKQFLKSKESKTVFVHRAGGRTACGSARGTSRALERR